MNRFRPDMLSPYASVGALLAGEQMAGRLRINPALVVLSAEGLPEDGYQRISDAFHVTVCHSYAATECPFISYSCDEGWLHVDSDWAILEPVDADHRPTPAGTLSHTVLITNLANRLQPILRYDLGDRILQRPDPCPCGNTLPAIPVEGRTADVLTFSTERGNQVSIPALMAEVVDAREVELFQIVQTTRTSLRVRLRLVPRADPDRVWAAVRREITGVLEANGLTHVTVEQGTEPPEQSAGGKYREVIPLSAADTAPRRKERTTLASQPHLRRRLTITKLTSSSSQPRAPCSGHSGDRGLHGGGHPRASPLWRVTASGPRQNRGRIGAAVRGARHRRQSASGLH